MFPNDLHGSRRAPRSSRGTPSAANSMVMVGRDPRLSRGPGSSVPIQSTAPRAQYGIVPIQQGYSRGDSRMLSARPSHLSSQGGHDGASMPPPPPFRQDQRTAGLHHQGSQHPSRQSSHGGRNGISMLAPLSIGQGPRATSLQASRPSSHHPSRDVREPSRHPSGFVEHDFMKVGAAPSRPQGFVDPREVSSRRPSESQTYGEQHRSSQTHVWTFLHSSRVYSVHSLYSSQGYGTSSRRASHRPSRGEYEPQDVYEEDNYD
jgi:hypothetical protein